MRTGRGVNIKQREYNGTPAVEWIASNLQERLSGEVAITAFTYVDAIDGGQFTESLTGEVAITAFTYV